MNIPDIITVVIIYLYLCSAVWALNGFTGTEGP